MSADMLKNLRGRAAFVFDEPNFDVDQIVGVSNIKIQDPETLAQIAMRRFGPDFRSAVRPGDLLVGGENFGYGHPHYQAMRAMRHMGVAGVVAHSFFQVYWRGEIAMGFPQVACPGIIDLVRRWDEIEVDWAAERVFNHTAGRSAPFEPLSHADREMLELGGFKAYLRRAVANDRAQASAQ